MTVKNKGLADSVNIKTLFICAAISLAVGTLSGVLNADAFASYGAFLKPPLAPPSVVFPIVWTLLYFLMGISSYIIYESGDANKKNALTLYALQLVLNFVWPFIFFMNNDFLFAFIWLLLLLASVVSMTVLFYKIEKKAGILQIPYVLWLSFAAYLNLGVYLLN